MFAARSTRPSLWSRGAAEKPPEGQQRLTVVKRNAFVLEEEDEEVSNARSHRIVNLLVCAGLSWAVSAVALLLLAIQRYGSSAVDQERRRYITAAAERVGFRAATVLSSGLAAHDAIRYAVRRRLYYDPLDYQAARAALAPVFAALPSLRAVDLAFSDRNESITLRRLLGDNSPGLGVQLLEQSDADDCADALGVTGCTSALPSRVQPWFALAQQLPPAEDAMLDIFQWDDGPAFVPATSSGGSAKAVMSVAWAPSYSLVFSSVFPGTRGLRSIVGRATLEVTGVQGEGDLIDVERLGPTGSIYVCDVSGAVIGAAKLSQQVVVESPTARVRFRRAWELQEPWAPSLAAADFAAAEERHLTAAGFRVAVVPLRGRGMGHFLAVVAAESGTFFDSRIGTLGTAAIGLAIMPAPAAVVIYALMYVIRWLLHRRHLRRVFISDTSSSRSPSESSAGSSRMLRRRAVPRQSPGGGRN